MNKRKYRYFMGDFETTVYDGQDFTEVWASACVELFSEEVQVFHSIGDTFSYLRGIDGNIIIYYHNLKFDGSFWLAYLLGDLKFKQAHTEINPDNVNDFEWIEQKYMKNNTFRYNISHMGQWYSILIKVDDRFIEIRDSYKLLPFSVKRIGQSFNTAHKKLDMEYKGFRYAGCVITDEEKEYIKNDVLVIKEALEIMFTEGHNKLTIGSCCLAEYKNIIGGGYDELFPDLYEREIGEEYGQPNAGEYIRKSYKGGWCYLVKGKEKKVYHNGTTADVNSLYPSMMSSESGNRYPFGLPMFWKGNYIPDWALTDDKYYFVRVRTRFYLKPNKLPFIQIKDNLLYRGNEALETSDIYDPETKRYYPEYIGLDGEVKQAILTLTLTMTDYELLKEHYELVDFEILDGCYFDAEVGLFDEYIDKYKKIKMESKGAMRELAKLFLNNLYGKMASNTESSFKVAYLKEDNVVGFYGVTANDKKPGYIAIGSAITSYARNFTIRAAQKNYHGVDKPGFIYADTDSIHVDLPPEKITGIKVDDKNFCCWKLESQWDTAFFVRQKTYIEHVVAEDLKPIEKPFYSVRCAGMPEKCKQLFLKSMEGFTPKKEGEEGYEEEQEKYTKEDIEFMSIKREITDFNVGLRVPGKLMPRRIKGGIVLVDTVYEMR